MPIGRLVTTAAATVTALVGGWLAPAFAQVQHPAAVAGNPPPVPAAPPPTFHRRWYGGQTLLVDAGAAAVFLLVAGLTDDHDLRPWSLSPYIAGPAVVHALNDNVLMSPISVGMRLIVPVVLAIGASKLGGRIGNETSGESGVGLIVGFLVGYAGVVAIDSALLAYKKVPVEPTQARSGRSGRRLALVPLLAAADSGVVFGAAGCF